MRRLHVLALVLVALAPIWAAASLPTQDGPSHVLNAIVFRACGDPATPEAVFYERRLELFPNWTAHVVMLGLTRVVPALVAEKVLASLYVVSLLVALAFFLRPFGGGTTEVALGLLLVYNRCFFLGFYNYLLGLALLLVILAVFIRWGRTPTPGRLALVSALLVLAWFTHLVAFALASFSLLWLAATTPGDSRLRRLTGLGLASLPGLVLTVFYLDASGFLGSRAGARAARMALSELAGSGPLEVALAIPARLHRELFSVYAGGWPLGMIALAIALVVSWPAGEPDGASGVAAAPSRAFRRPLAILAALILLVFVVVPDHLGAHGGFLKARLAPVPFLLGLSLLGPVRGRLRFLARLGVSVAVLTNAALLVAHVRRQDKALAQFTSAATLVAPGQTLLAVKAEPATEPLADPFAVELYCLRARAVCISNYEAFTRHFPVRLRAGAKERIKANRPGSFWADAVLGWGALASELPRPGEPYRLVKDEAGLRLFLKEP